MGERARIIIIVMLLTIIIIPISSNPSEAACPSGPAPGPSIQIAQCKQTAYVAPGQDGIVTFTGTVFAYIAWTPELDGFEVQLMPQAGDWVVSTPPSLNFTRADKQRSFSFQVCVPPGTSSSVMGQLTVHGKWRYLNSTSGGNIPPVTAIIFIEQFTMIDLDSPEGFISIDQGDRVRTSIAVHNRGNGKEKVNFEISNRKELEDNGWTIEFDPGKMTIDEGNNSVIDLTLKSTRKMKLGLYKVNISTKSSQSSSLDSDPFFNYTLFIEVKERELLGIKIKIWMTSAWSMIIFLSMIVSFVIMTRRKLTWILYSKLSKTRE